MGGNLTDKTIESMAYGPIESGPRKGQYRKYRLEVTETKKGEDGTTTKVTVPTEWNTDTSTLLTKEGVLKSKYADGERLYLQLAKNGTKGWLFDYAFPPGGKRTTLSYGNRGESRGSQREARGSQSDAPKGKQGSGENKPRQSTL